MKGCLKMEVCIEKCIHKDKVDVVLSKQLDSETILRLSEILKALGEPGRLKIVMSLYHEDLCVCDLSAISGLSESAVSHQLRILRNLKIVRNRREGKIMFYSLFDKRIVTLVNDLLTTIL